MGPTDPHNHKEPSAFSVGLHLPEREADHSLRHNAILYLPSLLRDNLTLWSWSWTFKFQLTIYVKCEYFMNLKNGIIVKYTTFCGVINGDVASMSKKKSFNILLTKYTRSVLWREAVRLPYI